MCVLSHTDVGGGRHLKLKLRRDGVAMDAIFFSANTAACGIENGQRLDIAFTLQINQFRGNRTVQLQLCDLRPAPTRSQLCATCAPPPPAPSWSAPCSAGSRPGRPCPPGRRP